MENEERLFRQLKQFGEDITEMENVCMVMLKCKNLDELAGRYQDWRIKNGYGRRNIVSNHALADKMEDYWSCFNSQQ